MYSLALVLLPALVESNAIVCSSPNALAKNFVVSLSTDTPKINENVTLVFDYDLEAPIVGGTAMYSATLNGLGPYTSSASLCNEVSKTGDSCPLVIGHHTDTSISANTVSGKVVTTITWYDPSDQEILCARVTTKSS